MTERRSFKRLIRARMERRATVALEHRRLADAEEAARMKDYWRQRLAGLKQALER